MAFRFGSFGSPFTRGARGHFSQIEVNRVSMYPTMRPLVLLLLCAALAGASDVASLLFLAATPTHQSPLAFGAALYRVDPKTNKLTITKQIVADSDGVDFVRADRNLVAIGYPHIKPEHICILDVNSPELGKTVLLPEDGTITQNTIVEPPGNGISELLQYTIPLKPYGIKTSLFDVVLQSPVDAKGTIVASYSAVKLANAHVAGEIGGPIEQWDGFKAHATNGAIIYDSSGSQVELIPSSPFQNSPREKVVSIMAANETYIVIARDEDALTHHDSIVRYIYNRREGRWSQISIPGNMSRIRLFGDWLAVVQAQSDVVYSSQIVEVPVRLATSGLSLVDRLYEQLMPPTTFPGKLLLIRLSDNKRLEIDTKRRDSEILLVNGREVLYRVDDTVFTCNLQNGRLLPATPVATDTAVPEIHWAFSTN